MNFKDIISFDLDTFFNPYEFGEKHNLDGEDVLAIVDKEQNQQYSSTQLNELIAQGIYESLVTVYVKAEDFKKPSIGYRLKLDGETFLVIDAIEEAGILKIELSYYES